MVSLKRVDVELIQKHLSCFSRVLKECLKVQKGETVLIITDQGQEENQHVALMIAYGYYLALEQQKIPAKLLVQGVKKGFMHLDLHVQEELLALKDPAVLLVSVSNKLGKFEGMNSFRTFCKEKGHRFASASGLGDATNSQFPLFMEAMNLNYKRLQRRGEKIKKVWDKAKSIRVTSELGTDLTFDVTGMQAVANTGDYRKAGQGGNIPAGEVYIAPVGMQGVSGTLVLDGSIRLESGSTLLSSPLTLHIENGSVISAQGEDAPLLLETFERFEARAKFPSRVRMIGELGIGINPGAVLMGIALIDEKVEQTGHVGIGSNSWFGGAIKSIYHGDQVFKNPTYYVDGKEMKL